MTFEEYVAARGAALVRIARLLTGDDDRADALVGDVLARAYERWPQIMKNERPDVDLRRMLVDRDRWRRPRRPATGDPTWQRIARLPRRERAVLALRCYEDLDDMVIAEILDCSPAAVRAQARRALSRVAGP